MDNRPLLIIHGWSDHSASFRRLAELLRLNTGRDIRLINLANYITMDDEITFDDIVSAMSKAWKREGLPETGFATDVIVHSTGGLIVRDWLTRNYTPNNAPIKHLVMLAPANFGSPLAHKGQSFFGRVIKGFDSPKLFQIGIKILQGLELASPYTWQLAMRDRFSGNDFYGPKKILCTTLVGNTGFTGISAAGNEDGSDGVVRVSTANMECAFLEADFSHDPLHPTFTYRKSTGETAFAILNGENHSTIAAKEGGFKNRNTLSFILRALSVEDDDFELWRKELHQANRALMDATKSNSTKNGFQNTVFLVQNQFGKPIEDYFLEFYLNGKGTSWFAEIFHRDVITTVHAYSEDKSYRSIYANCTVLREQLLEDAARPWDSMSVSLTALPEFKRNGNVGYRTFGDKDIGAIKLMREEVSDVFVENRSLFVHVTLRREQADKVFEIYKLG
jgi:pimeloyl-ACP methyl ester carboxylesterase